MEPPPGREGMMFPVQLKKVTFILIVMLLALYAIPVYAQMPLPHSFYGKVEINDSAATPGVHVKATGENVDVPSDYNPVVITAEISKGEGWYGSSVWNEPRLVVQGFIDEGTELEFYVSKNGVTWVKAVTDPAVVEWHSGALPTRVDLTAKITPSNGGGGGGGVTPQTPTPPPDTVAPKISDIRSCYEGVTETTADICWTTDEDSSSQMKYWASPAILSPLDETLVTSHHIHLTELTPATTYYYNTMSEDTAGNLAISPEYTFTTLGVPPPPEEVPPEEAPPEEAPPEEAPPEEVPTEPAPKGINWPMIGGIIGGVVVGLVIFFVIRRRKAY